MNKPTKNEERLAKLKNLLDRKTGQIKKIKREQEKKRAEKRKRQIKVENDYINWVEELRPEAEKSAHIILEWVEEILGSETWKKMKSDYIGTVSGINISENIVYEGPRNNYYHSYGTDGNQSLSLDFSGRIFVHNNVKYGKSYEIRNKKEMMQQVDFPVIIKIAETIKDGSIWGIIETELERRIEEGIEIERDGFEF